MGMESVPHLLQAQAQLSVILGVFGGVLGAVSYQLIDALLERLINSLKPGPAEGT